MAAPDLEWVRAKLEEFIQLSTPVTTLGIDKIPSAPEHLVVTAAEVIEQIFARFYPDWRAVREPDKRYRWAQHHEAAIRCLSRVNAAAELAERLGDSAPTLTASGFHAWVWDAARSLWNTGHYREAVEAAAKSINAHTQAKIDRRDVSEGDLFAQAFSDDPARPGASRLRPLGGADDSKTAKSIRRGIRDYASGCFAAIRNPKAHDDPTVETPEHEALEQLAALSVLARWADSATVSTG